MKSRFKTAVFPVATVKSVRPAFAAIAARAVISAVVTANAAARDPRAKSADPRFVRELEQSGVIDQLYAQSR